MQVTFRIAGTTLDGMAATLDTALNAFFGTTPYTYDMEYIQGDFDYDEDGKPSRYQGDVTANTI
jgi:hypothetical protein